MLSGLTSPHISQVDKVQEVRFEEVFRSAFGFGMGLRHAGEE